MKNTIFHGYNLSRFMLGTVQFGQSYGIANKTGQPPYQAVLKILEYALENGVNCLDTAAAYGDSEEVIGKVLQELRLTGQMVVVTKVPPVDDNLPAAKADYVVEQSVVSSLQRLRLDVLPLCLFHNERNAVYADSLLKMKEKGLVKHVGVSVNSPGGALNALRSGKFEALQVPTSILDHRYYRAGIFIEAKRRGMALFVRSVYLQGLIFMPEQEIHPQLAPVIEVRKRLEKIAAEAGLSLADLAVRFVMGLEGADCLVMGLETLEQLQANLKVFAHGPLNPGLMRAVMEAVPQLPDNVIVPALWPKVRLDRTR